MVRGHDKCREHWYRGVLIFFEQISSNNYNYFNIYKIPIVKTILYLRPGIGCAYSAMMSGRLIWRLYILPSNRRNGYFMI